MSKPTVLMLAGYAKAGKDTFADGVVASLSVAYSSSRFKFAGALRSSLALALRDVGLGQIDVWTEDPKIKETLRPLLVEYGKYCRSVDANIFAQKTLEDVNTFLKLGGDLAIVTDLRYANELKVFEAGLWSEAQLVSILIVRRFNLAANEEEARSIEELQRHSQTVQVFNDGDIEDIKLHAQDWVTINFPKPLTK